MTEEPKKRGRPEKVGEEATKLRPFRLTSKQYEEVKAFVRSIKERDKKNARPLC